MRNIPPISPSFSGHQTFPFRYTWLKKGVDAVIENPTIFSAADASVTLGVGKNMVDSIRHWCRATRLIKEDTAQSRRGQFAPTQLGKDIFAEEGFDPYLEDPATLWIIHYQIATGGTQATAWYWAFNILTDNPFMPDIFTQKVYRWAQQQRPGMRLVSDNTLRRDVNCFLRTYCQSRDTTAVVEDTFDCPLVELNLISELMGGDGYEFQRGEKETLSTAVVAWALNTFWKHPYPWAQDTFSANEFSQRNSLAFSELMYAPSSPGRVFRLDEDTLTVYLEDLAELTDGAFEYDETTGLKQLYRQRDLNEMELLERCYG